MGKLAGGPWKELGLALLLLGVLHLINNSVQDGLSCWSLCPFRSASSLLLLVPPPVPPSLPRLLLGNYESRIHWVSPGRSEKADSFKTRNEKRQRPCL